MHCFNDAAGRLQESGKTLYAFELYQLCMNNLMTICWSWGKLYHWLWNIVIIKFQRSIDASTWSDMGVWTVDYIDFFFYIFFLMYKSNIYKVFTYFKLDLGVLKFSREWIFWYGSLFNLVLACCFFFFAVLDAATKGNRYINSCLRFLFLLLFFNHFIDI